MSFIGFAFSGKMVWNKDFYSSCYCLGEGNPLTWSRVVSWSLSFLLLFGTPAVWWHRGPVQSLCTCLASLSPSLRCSHTGQLSVLRESQALGTCHGHHLPSCPEPSPISWNVSFTRGTPLPCANSCLLFCENILLISFVKLLNVYG